MRKQQLAVAIGSRGNKLRGCGAKRRMSIVMDREPTLGDVLLLLREGGDLALRPTA